MTIDREAWALLQQYAEAFAELRNRADEAGDFQGVAIHDAQIDLVLHLIATLDMVP